MLIALCRAERGDRSVYDVETDQTSLDTTLEFLLGDTHGSL